MDFKTLKGLNFQLALYMLSIRAPQPPFPPVSTFIFPLSPQRIRKVFVGMSVPYDTMGTPYQAGVNREIDQYGISPFTYEIEGTTGWDYHMTDGFLTSGLAAIQNLQQMFLQYGELNAIQQANNDPNSYTMEFADFFNGEFYQVEPLGPLEIRASERAPLLQYYRLRLVGVQPLAAPLVEPIIQAIELLMNMTPASAAGTVAAEVVAITSLY